MRALAITGMVTASLISSIFEGSAMRATPPAARMSAGTRSSAITAAAPADSATRAWSAVTTSMITPPLSISARPAFTRNVAVSRIALDVIRTAVAFQVRNRRLCYEVDCRQSTVDLFEAERPDAIRVRRLVQRVHAVRERLDEREQRGMRAHV